MGRNEETLNIPWGREKETQLQTHPTCRSFFLFIPFESFTPFFISFSASLYSSSHFLTPLQTAHIASPHTLPSTIYIFFLTRLFAILSIVLLFFSPFLIHVYSRYGRIESNAPAPPWILILFSTSQCNLHLDHSPAHKHKRRPNRISFKHTPPRCRTNHHH